MHPLIDPATSSTAVEQQTGSLDTRIVESDITAVVGENFVGVIKPPDTPICHGQQISTWTPSTNEVSKADRRILEYLEKFAPTIADRQNEYIVQYLGIDTPDGRQIYCNFHHASDISDGYDVVGNIRHLLTEYAGSSRHGFAITYNPESDTCFDFEIAPLLQQ